jgi:AraC-like DNA-binding protein
MQAASLSPFDYYRQTFVRDGFCRSDAGPSRIPGVQYRERMQVVLGSGYMERILFPNGLMAGRGVYRLGRAYQATYTDIETFFGFGLLIEGNFVLEIPELRLRQPIEADQLWLRSGRVRTLHCAHPGERPLSGVSIDTTAGLLEAWKDEAPASLNPGVRAVLKSPGPLLRRLPGSSARVRELCMRMLALDTATLCGRLQFESLALDLLAGVLQAEGGTRGGLTRSERRETRLRRALEDARDILDSEWPSPPTIAELSRRVGLNECYLKSGFRERYGCTIGAHVRMCRMEHARRLIEREGYGAQQAAFAVGFSNPGWFSATFKQYFGYLPSSLIREAEGGQQVGARR